ncbi:MAG: hypothetical protein DLM68_07295 [Hyphomicrobiales bacterium]|nr:MAG: hypothetical protein DLM68_07295 [Hyphomicrobiales bacterium]
MAKDMPMQSAQPRESLLHHRKMGELDGLADASTGGSSNAADDGIAFQFTQSQYSSVRKELVDFIGSNERGRAARTDRFLSDRRRGFPD